jgi:sigma-B regulation protein RsbU (phosphoserine phosphatase)
MLAASLVTLVLIAVISYNQMLSLTKYSQDANITLGITASEKSRMALLGQAEEYLAHIARKQVEGSNATLRQVRIELAALGEYLEWLYADPDGFKGRDVPFVPDAPDETPSAKYMLAPGVAETDAIMRELNLVSNAEYAFSGLLKNHSLMDNIYLGTETGISYRYSISNVYNPEYDPRERGWYKAATESPGAIWLDTYVDVYGSVTVTCATAFKDGAGRHVGVVATDIFVSEIVDSILELRIGTNGYAFLLDADGAYIAHPDYGKEGFDANPAETATGSWRDALLGMTDGVFGASVVNIDDEEFYLFSAPIEETGWIFCVNIPVAEVIAPAESTWVEINAIADETQNFIRETLSSALMRFIVIFAVVAILAVTFSLVTSAGITKPIENLTKMVRRISDGDLDAAIEVKGKDEIADLSAAFNKMTADIKAHIRDIQTITAEKERIGAELNVATNIQASMLPHIFPPFPERRDLDIFAVMTPAKEVGGDFYDFFIIGNSLWTVMADVSGKGVPAALFMVIAKTLLKNNAQSGLRPKEVLEVTNNILCENNDEVMFVTVFIGRLDLETGLYVFANAGHNPPLLKRGDGNWEMLKIKRRAPLGTVENINHTEEELLFKPGDSLFLYTDGVTEAENRNHDLFGDARLTDCLAGCGTDDPEELLHNVKSDIDAFADGAAQFDDITMLCFRYKEAADS